jgi:hypothetical protein
MHRSEGSTYVSVNKIQHNGINCTNNCSELSGSTHIEMALLINFVTISFLRRITLINGVRVSLKVKYVFGHSSLYGGIIWTLILEKYKHHEKKWTGQQCARLDLETSPDDNLAQYGTTRRNVSYTFHVNIRTATRHITLRIATKNTPLCKKTTNNNIDNPCTMRCCRFLLPLTNKCKSICFHSFLLFLCCSYAGVTLA